MNALDAIRALRGRRFLISSETVVQRQLAIAFREAGLDLQREVIVMGGRVDFCERPRGLAVEVKIKGSARDFHRQIAGYAEDPTIDEILLVTTKACGMPPFINGKTVRVFGLGGAHL